jgi:hypothetical protein
VLQDDVCIGMLQQFIAQHPKLWSEDIDAVARSQLANGAFAGET